MLRFTQKLMKKKIIILIVSGLIIANCSTLKSTTPHNKLNTQTTIYDNIEFNSFLLKDDNQVALWLGEKINNKYLAEPINIVIIDEQSQSNIVSIKSIENELINAGFTKKNGHSSGYIAVINKTTVDQLPKEYRVAYSDNNSWTTNNHGRLFGPYTTNKNKRIYIGQFSRESFRLFASVHHKYVSFNVARDQLIKRANKYSKLKYVSDFKANNSTHSDLFTSGDHDGLIKILSLQK